MTTEFEKIVNMFRNVSEILVNFTYPKAHPLVEQDIYPLRSTTLAIDGYDIGLHFTKADYGDYYLESVQIFGNYSPFLPFNLVVKIARKILGNEHLSFMEFYQVSKKIYCWSVCKKLDGEVIEPPFKNKSQVRTFDGFKYSHIDFKELNLY